MAEHLHEKVKCKACGGQLSLTASSACHDITLIDVLVECDGCEQILNYFIDMDEMSVFPGDKKQ